MLSTIQPEDIATRSWRVAHALSVDDAARMAVVREQAAPNKGRLRGVAARPMFDAMNEGVVAPQGVDFREDSVGGIPGTWCTPQGALSGVTLMHLHGGWFNWGKANAFRNLVGQIAARSGLEAFIPDYRLAPEHPFPAALEDAAACFRALTASRTGKVVVSGDSAGGNLALLLASSQTPPPVAVVALSSVTDLALTGRSWETKAEDDPYFLRSQVEELVTAYLAGHDPADPAASPLYGVLTDAPPIQIQVGSVEVLLDDAQRFAQRAADTGVAVELHVWEGMAHGFVSGIGRFDASSAALSEIARFLGLHAGTK